MKELNVLQMEEIEGGSFWACASAVLYAASCVAAVVALGSTPITAPIAVAAISAALSADAAMIAACT